MNENIATIYIYLRGLNIHGIHNSNLGLALARPEIVPFRLTPNMIDALGLSGVEGLYRQVCQVTMTLLRSNKETVLSVLESFVHDPLVEWSRSKHQSLHHHPGPTNSPSKSEAAKLILKKIDERLRGIYNLQVPRSSNNRRKSTVGNNSRTTTRKGETVHEEGLLPLSVQGQVDRLIQEAVSEENLAQMYFGWMPFL